MPRRQTPSKADLDMTVRLIKALSLSPSTVEVTHGKVLIDVRPGEPPEDIDPIDWLPAPLRNPLQCCFGSKEEIEMKRQFAHLVVTFGSINERPAVLYRYGGRPLTAGTILYEGDDWTEIILGDFLTEARTMNCREFFDKFGPLPPLPDWLFQYPNKERSAALRRQPSIRSRR